MIAHGGRVVIFFEYDEIPHARHARRNEASQRRTIGVIARVHQMLEVTPRYQGGPVRAANRFARCLCPFSTCRNAGVLVRVR